MSPPLARTALKKRSIAGQTPAKRPSFTVTPSLVPGLHIIGTSSGVLRESRWSWPMAVSESGCQERNSRSQPAGGDAIWVQQTSCHPPKLHRRCAPTAPRARWPVRDDRTLRRDRSATSETQRRSRCADRTTAGSRQPAVAHTTEPSRRSRAVFASACQCKSKAPVRPDLHDPSPQPC